MTYILAIESSCDESSISIIKNEEIIKTITFSQEEKFKKIGGVIPELASRMHEKNLPLILNQIKSEFNLDKLSAVAATVSPGLIGCLQMGLQMAKTISLFYDIPLITIDHIVGHIYSAEIEHEYKYPLIALIASGGNTQLVYVKKEMDFNLLGQTQDDAVGECFDKVARTLGLGYPGGPAIDEAANMGECSFDFSIANLKGYDFSYSGLKSAVLNHLNSMKMKGQKIKVNDIACSFQSSAIKQLINKTQKAVAEFNVKQVVVVGGVSANSLLRKSFNQFNEDIIFPSLKYCTDNAAMIAKVAIKKYKNNEFANLEAKASPNNKIT